MGSVTLMVSEKEATPLIGVVTETEATPLVGIVPAQDANAKAPRAAAPLMVRGVLRPTWMEDMDRLVAAAPRPLSDEQLQMLRRHRQRGHFEQLAMEREVAMEGLRYYNLKNPGNEYEPAPGKVYWTPHFHNGICWTHGNFVARRKRSGWFSFLPAPRTLFFFEHVHTKDFDGVITCTPLDEPVTESYSVLGFALGFSTRRSGKFDSFCKTCYSRFDVPHPGIQKTFPCGHRHVQKVCEMCYLRSHLLHPHPGEFAFGYRDPFRPYPTKH